MDSWLGTTGKSIKAFCEAIVKEDAAAERQVLSASVAVPENTVPAISTASAQLAQTLLSTAALSPDALICAFFTSDLTATYPARAVREALGWSAVPLLCAQEVHPPAQGQHTISAVLLADARQPAERARQPGPRGIRGATMLNEHTGEALAREIHWLLNELLAENHLDLASIARVVVTVTPDLDMAAARDAAQACLGPAIPLLVAQEIDVPDAPRRCARVLLLATMEREPRPVYSEQARRLLRPDLAGPPLAGAAPGRWSAGSATALPLPVGKSAIHPTPADGDASGTSRAAPQSVRVFPSGPLHGEIAVPASKYHTLRAMLAAFLADGVSVIEHPALSDDTAILLQACAQLGAAIETRQDEGGGTFVRVQGTGGRIALPGPVTLDMGNAGAVLRLLLGICASSATAITFTTGYPESLGRRPNADLLQALAQLGARVSSQGPHGALPITLQGGNLRGGKVQLLGGQSSQYLSALLYLGPLLEVGLEIEVVDTLTSASFVDLTIAMLQQSGITIHTLERCRRYQIPGGQRYRPQRYRVPGDYPSAAALLAAVAVAGGEITLHHLAPDDASGEAVLEAFAQMGLHISRKGCDITASRQAPLRGIVFDGSRAIDSVPCLAAATCFATTPSRIHHIANLRLKESDRIYDLAAALQACGCQITPGDDALSIAPAESIAGGAAVDAHADHRLVQALAVVGLGSQAPITVRNAQHVAKSYPQFFDDLASLGARIEFAPPDEAAQLLQSQARHLRSEGEAAICSASS